MKPLLTSLFILAALSATAQQKEDVVQSGTPALLEVANGKTIRVMLQKLEDGNLTFQPYKKDNDITAPISKISRLGFSMDKEQFDFFRTGKIISDEKVSEIFKMPDLSNAAKLELIFKAVLENIAATYNSGGYAGVIAALEPLMLERGPYMAIENNLQDVFVMLMESYRKEGDWVRMRECAAYLQESDDSRLAAKARVCLALAAIAEGRLDAAEQLRGEIESEAASLYLQASMQRARGAQKEAILTVTGIIAEHANDVEWLAPSEFLSAQLYLEMAMTNSAANTARQVKNIYAGTHVAADAQKLYTQLGGEEATD
jgi:hypothetical protein